jgi:prolyl oligopeptidase
MPANLPLTYPNSPTGNQVDDYHGISVADPYRWLEDPASEDSQAWIAAQNKVTFDFLDQIPLRQTIKQRLTELWNYERYSTPGKQGDRYFYFKNDGLQNQSVLYKLDTLDSDPQVLLDPNTLSEDGTVALAGLDYSEDGSKLLYGISRSGSDWQEWRVRDVTSGQDLDDHLQWIKFSGMSWSKDNQGFFYSRYDEPQEATKLEDVNRFQKLYYHRLGTPQSADILVYERPDQPEWGFSGGVTEDGRYLVISVWLGSDRCNLLFYKDLSKVDFNNVQTLAETPVVELIQEFEAKFSFVDNNGSSFWIKTDLEAPKGKLIAIDLQQPDRAHWQTLIPEAEETLQSISLLNNQFVVSYLKDARDQVKCFGLDGQFDREIILPGLGSVGGFGGKRHETETFYSFTSFTTPGTVYHYDFATHQSTLWRQPQVAFNPDDYQTEQVFYTSKDGTRIPMFLVHKKGLVKTGKMPVYLYGYGGFNVSLTPSFSVSLLSWLERGGIYALANLRGGGEYGKAWHQAGTKLQKQNVFDDFISAAEWLIAEGYTSPQKLAIAGGSNGGLLVGACMTQRPDLFGAALPAVGVMDMLRFHKFTIGWAWCSDYGSSENPEEFPALYAYSPLHNLKPGTAYPATLVTTADHDDRVVPAHSFKFAAALQAAQAGPAPVLIRIETKAGHGAGKPTAKVIEEAADKWGFVLEALGETP